MTRHTAATVLALVCLFAVDTASAAITGARATPRQVTLVGSGSNLVSVNWQVSTTAGHVSGASSAFGAIIDPATGTQLQRINVPLDAVGAGPYSLRELVTLDAATVRTWVERGLTRVVLERSFGDPATGSLTSANVVLLLRASRLQAAREAAPAALSVIALQLEFDSGNNAEIVGTDETLRALLTVQYTGTGVLHGRWQIAEPESSEGVPMYRTLALVNTNLQTSQRSTLRSPALPSARPGKYLLRFCVTSVTDVELTGDAQCPDIDLIAIATYQVRQEDAVKIIGGVSPDRQTVARTTPFRWNSVPEAALYQLQVFEFAAPQTEPRFVTGMLLDARTSATPLSMLARSKLAPGHRYVWRVTAHDANGRLVGQSADGSFVYGPDQ